MLPPQVLEWVERGEEDFLTAESLSRRRQHDLLGQVCFHAQQAAEKYLKALLVLRTVHFPKTHHLLRLLALTLPSDPGLDSLQDDLLRLNPFGIAVRYPGARASLEDARGALRSARRVRKGLRKALGLEGTRQPVSNRCNPCNLR